MLKIKKLARDQFRIQFSRISFYLKAILIFPITPFGMKYTNRLADKIKNILIRMERKFNDDHE